MLATQSLHPRIRARGSSPSMHRFPLPPPPPASRAVRQVARQVVTPVRNRVTTMPAHSRALPGQRVLESPRAGPKAGMVDPTLIAKVRGSLTQFPVHESKCGGGVSS